MPKHVIVTDGQDFLTRPALEYLDSTYGIPAEDIRSLEIYSEANQAQTITVTLFVRDRSALRPPALDPTGAGPYASGGPVSGPVRWHGEDDIVVDPGESFRH
jgi:hypothetical protein